MQDADLFLLYPAGQGERLQGDAVVEIAARRDVCWLECRNKSGFESPKI